MVNRFAVYGKKILGLSLIFNSLLSIIYAIGLLAGFYAEGWALFEPYLIEGALFWMLIFVSIINIFPATVIGQVRTGRLWFHHYVYGFLVFVIAILFLILLAPIPLFNIFTANTTNITVVVGRFFVLGGLTLILDDLPDVSKRLRRVLEFLKIKANQGRRIMHLIQYTLSCLSIYLFLAILMYITQNPESVTIANMILCGTVLVTSLMSFAVARRKIWLRIAIQKD